MTAPQIPERTLTPKQARFIDEYLIDLNASGAYRRAGYAVASPGVASMESARLLANPAIAAAIAKRKEEICARLGIQQEQVLREYARIAFANVRNYAKVTDDGVTITPSDQWSDDAAAAVAEVGERRGKYGTSVHFKLHDKIAALNKLAIYTQLMPAEEGGDTPTTINNVTQVNINVRYDYDDPRR